MKEKELRAGSYKLVREPGSCYFVSTQLHGICYRGMFNESVEYRSGSTSGTYITG